MKATNQPAKAEQKQPQTKTEVVPSQPQEKMQAQPQVKTEVKQSQPQEVKQEKLDSPTQLDNRQGQKNKEKVEALQTQLKVGSLRLNEGETLNVYQLRDHLVVQADPSKELKKLVEKGYVDEKLERAIKIEMQRLGHSME